MNDMNKILKLSIFLSGAIFLMIFVLEMLCFRDIVIVDPQVHNISYENWGWFIKEWEMPMYWERYSEQITIAAHTLNSIFRFIFGAFTVFIFAASDRFSLRKVWVFFSVAAIAVADIGIRFFIKYNVDFYRLYMYAIYNALMASYMIFCARRYKT